MGTNKVRIAAAIAVIALSAGCTGATEPPENMPSPGSSVSATTGPVENSPSPGTSSSPEPSVSPSSEPTKAATPPPGESTPLPKVQRSGDASNPTVSAEPAEIKEELAYGDGVALRIADVEFGEETKEGPGRFPGRGYAILSLEILNGGKEPIDLDTTVVTVLDAEDQQIAPVYVEEADVADFAGKVKPGKTAKARYAFAVPKASRSQVTVVVDFDGVHTSAVFRGGLS